MTSTLQTVTREICKFSQTQTLEVAASVTMSGHQSQLKNVKSIKTFGRIFSPKLKFISISGVQKHGSQSDATLLSASNERLVIDEVDVGRLSSLLQSREVLDGWCQSLDVTLVTTASVTALLSICDFAVKLAGSHL